jgi:hypothetical protein
MRTEFVCSFSGSKEGRQPSSTLTPRSLPLIDFTVRDGPLLVSLSVSRS